MAKTALVSKPSDRGNNVSASDRHAVASDTGNGNDGDEFAVISALGSGSGSGSGSGGVGSTSASADLRSATVGIVAHTFSILTQLIGSASAALVDGVSDHAPASSNGTGGATTSVCENDTSSKEHRDHSTLINAVLFDAPTVDTILSLITSHSDPSVRCALAAGLFRFAVIAQRLQCDTNGANGDALASGLSAPISLTNHATACAAATATATANGSLVGIENSSSVSKQPLIALLNRVWTHTLPLSNDAQSLVGHASAQRRHLNEAFSLLQASFAHLLSSSPSSSLPSSLTSPSSSPSSSSSSSSSLSSSSSSLSLPASLSLSSRLDHLLALLSALPAGRETADAEDAVVRGYIGLFAALLNGCPAWASQRRLIDVLIKRALFALPPATASLPLSFSESASATSSSLSSSSSIFSSSSSSSSSSLYPSGWAWSALCEHRITRAAAFALLYQLGGASALNAAHIQQTLGVVLYGAGRDAGGRMGPRGQGSTGGQMQSNGAGHNCDEDEGVDEDDDMDVMAVNEDIFTGASSSSSSSSSVLWSLHPDDDRRTTHVGLRNLGATCYINSLMQQLFHAPGFADDIEALEFVDASASFSSSAQVASSESTSAPASSSANHQANHLGQVSNGNDNDDDNGRRMFTALQTAFRCMRRSQRRSHDIGALISTLRDWEGQRINVQQQQDVNEVCALAQRRGRNHRH